jgi:hypothetical protein
LFSPFPALRFLAGRPAAKSGVGEPYTIGKAISPAFLGEISFFFLACVRSRARGEFHTTCRNGIVIKTVVPASLKISNEAASP